MNRRAAPGAGSGSAPCTNGNWRWVYEQAQDYWCAEAGYAGEAAASEEAVWEEREKMMGTVLLLLLAVLVALSWRDIWR